MTTGDTAVVVHVLSYASDSDGDTLTVSAVTQGGYGTVTINTDNTVTYDSRSLQLPESRVRAHYVKAASRSANTPTACSPCSTGRGCWRATTPIVNPSKENESVRRPPRDPLRRGELEPCGFVDSRFAPAHKLHKANSRSKPKRTNDVLRKPVNSECYRQCSGDFALPSMTGQRRLRAGNLHRGDVNVIGKAEQQGLLGAQVIQDTSEKTRFGGGEPDLLRAETRKREKPAEPLRLSREIGKCLNCQRFCRLPPDRFALAHGNPFAVA